MPFTLKLIPLTIIFLLTGSASFAQKQKQPVNKNQAKFNVISDKELGEFLNIYGPLEDINEQTEERVQFLFAQSNITVKRYRAAQKKVKADSLNVTKQEVKAYRKLRPKLVKLQRKMQKKLKAEVKKNGLPWPRFQQISSEMQTNEKLRLRFQKMMRKQIQSNGSNRKN
jgi:hypothetical protein